MLFAIEETPYLCVLLDDGADIVDIALHLEDTEYTREELLGKNWFETFIDEEYTDEIRKVFENVLAGLGSFTTYENDIRCKDGTHRLIDFHNTVFEKEGRRYVRSIGVEHHHNVYEALNKLVEKLGDKCEFL